MTPAAYKKLREARGTQAAVAAQLGISRSVLGMRETGRYRITTEMRLAMEAVPLPSPLVPGKRLIRRPGVKRDEKVQRSGEALTRWAKER